MNINGEIKDDRRAEGATDRRGQPIGLNPIRQLGISKQLSERNSEYIGIYLPVLTLKLKKDILSGEENHIRSIRSI